MIPSITGISMQPQLVTFPSATAALSKVSQGEEAAETAAQRVAELSNNGEQTESATATTAAVSGTLGRNIDLKA